MNLTSYGPEVKKCMQDAVSKMASANTTDLDSSKSNSAASSTSGSNSSSNASDNSASSSSKNSTSQKSDSSQTSKQTSDQSSSMDQTAGLGSVSFDGSSLFLVIGVIALFAILGFTMSKIMNKNRDD